MIFAVIAASPAMAATPIEAQPSRRIVGQQLTADGEWLAYQQVPPGPGRDGNVTVVLRHTRKPEERRFEAGSVQRGAGQLRLSACGKWAAFLVAPGTEAARLSLALVELRSGRRIDFSGIRTFSFNAKSGDWLAFAGDTTPLTLRHLASGRTQTMGLSGRFAFDPTGRRLAWIRTSNGRSQLFARELASAKQQSLDEIDASYGDWAWSPGGAQLAVLRAEPSPSLLVVSGLAGGEVRKRIFRPESWAGFPPGFELSMVPALSRDSMHRPASRPALAWRADEQGLFFGIRERAQPSSGEGSASPESSGRPIIWHWQDDRLPVKKAWEEHVDRSHSFLAFVSFDDGRLVRLADGDLEQVFPHPDAESVLGFDDRAYRREGEITGRVRRDYYLVRVRDGQRSLLRDNLLLPRNSRLGLPPLLSPNGRSALFVDGVTGDYVALDIATGVERVITDGLPVKFYDPDLNPIAMDGFHQLQPLQGWTRDGEHVLVTDSYDVWALPLRGGRAVNLTGLGRGSDTRYILTSLDIETERLLGGPMPSGTPMDARVDLNRTLYFRTLNFTTMDTGLAERQQGDKSARQIARVAADVRYLQASGGKARLILRQTAVEPPTFYRSDGEWRIGAALADVDPRGKGVPWTSGVRLLSYGSDEGKPLRALLHLPANYQPGRRYPAIVDVYEMRSQGLHAYRHPEEHGDATGADPTFWTSRGYAVLWPDIRPRWNRMSEAVEEDVAAALRAVEATGVVDTDRLGLVGHSFGGYEASVLATRARRFKAIVSSSGSVDWMRNFTEVFEPRGRAWGYLAESGFQPFIPQPWWENREAATINSPIFEAVRVSTPLLLIHGRKDAQVRFSHSEQFFNVLRRMGDKPVVLLEYPDEGHVILSPPAVRDAERRQLEFFDHFLKGAAAPDWWKHNP